MSVGTTQVLFVYKTIYTPVLNVVIQVETWVDYHNYWFATSISCSTTTASTPGVRMGVSPDRQHLNRVNVFAATNDDLGEADASL
jgi:hypothetical protein